MSASLPHTSVPRFYRTWFYAAAAYNMLWGITAVLFPFAYYRLIGMDESIPTVLFQCIGMMVGVYAYGYYLLGRDPVRYQGMVWVGLAGKALGPLGCIYSALQGNLPWSFLWLNLGNDVIWLPVFVMFAWNHARHPFGSEGGR